jgi:RNA polymerase sigma-70 factor (ECF subfamily)
MDFGFSKGRALNHKGPAISAGERQALLLRAQGRDPEALNVLFESCREVLYCRALRILARPHDAEDAVQEAMVAAFTHLDRFQGRSDFLTWATRIVMNAALQHIRKFRTKPTVSWDQVGAEFETWLSEYVKDPRPTPEEQLQSLEHRERLEDALLTLPDEMRRVMQFCRSTDYSLKEAASALGLSLATLKTRLHRGRHALMIHLKKEAKVRRQPSVNRSSQRDPASKKSLGAA